MPTEKLYPEMLQEAANLLKQDMIGNLLDIVVQNQEVLLEDLQVSIDDYLQDFVIPNMSFLLDFEIRGADAISIANVPNLSFSIEIENIESEIN